MSNYNEDALLHKIDEEIDKTEQQILELELTLKPYKDHLNFLSDVRRRISGLTVAPTRDMIKDKSTREVALEEEVFRLREQLNKGDSFKKSQFDY